MSRNRETKDPGYDRMEFLDLLKEWGGSLGHDLFRVILYADGRLEAELQAHNPWECLVLKLDSYKDALTLLNKGPRGTEGLWNAVIRKKCTKCFLHERDAAADVASLFKTTKKTA
jgi:hypothetical protein